MQTHPKKKKRKKKKGFVLLNFSSNFYNDFACVLNESNERVWWRLRCKSSDQLDFSLQSEREDQMSCGQEKQQLLDCTWRRWSQCKGDRRFGKALLQKIMLLSIWVHSCIFSQDLGCWDRFACEYLTTILHHFGSVNAWILQLPTAICGPTSGLWCGVLLILVFVAYVADGKKWKWLLRKTGERARLEEEIGSSLTCLHWFFCLSNSSWLTESLMSVFAGTIMLSDFGCCM